MADADGIRILHPHGVTRLKWHRAKRRAADLPFSAERISEGFRLGASFEVDIRPHAGAGFLVLHDETLDRETTGSGPVRSAMPETLRRLRMRAQDGAPTDRPLLLLEDLCGLATGHADDPDARCQLDLKAAIEDLDAAAVEAFAVAVRPAPSRFVVSGGDAKAVRRLGAAAGIAVGYDPSDGARGRDMTRSADADAFVAGAVAAMPEAVIVYLDWKIVISALDAGVDLISRFHDARREVDVYTLDRSIDGWPLILRRLLSARVDQITTDEPGALGPGLELASTGVSELWVQR